jgi:phosphatidylglycerol---prolipoprotein diacylglyceryl transferase
VFPILWQAGPVTLYTHDVFSVAAIVVGLAIYYWELRSRGLLESRIVAISAAVVIGGVLGARTITAWEHPEFYVDSVAAGMSISWTIEHGGKSILGAIAGGYLAGYLAKRGLGYRRSTGDCYALALAIATAIGRIGCFLSELPLGTATSLPWGIAASPAAAAAFPRCPDCTAPMHPSMLYEVLFNVIAAVAIIRWRHRVTVQGDLLKLYLLAAFAFRFLVESVRANELQPWGLTGPQTVLIPLLILLVAHFIRQARRGVYRLPEPPSPGLAEGAP